MSTKEIAEISENLPIVEDMPEYDGYDEKGGYWLCKSSDESDETECLSSQPAMIRMVIDAITVLMHQYLDSAASLLGLDPCEKKLVSDTLQAFIDDKKNTL